MPRWIIRPRNISTTPHALAQGLNCQTRKYPSARNIRRGFSWADDFFLIYPDPDTVRFSSRVSSANDGADGAQSRTVYQRCYRFFSQHKAGQRVLLKSMGIPVPDTTTRQDVAATWMVQDTTNGERSTGSPRFIVRPLRHSGGIGFRLTSNPTDFTHEEYVQRVYPKSREYRLIYVKGTFLVTLRKHVPTGTSPSLPWNHSIGSTFKTVNPETCKLAGTDAFIRLAANPIIQSAHLVAVDVMWNRDGYVVCEFNSCPGLTIENNLLRIIQHVKVTELIR